MAPDAGKREISFRVFATTPGIIEKQHEESVAQAFSTAFKDDTVAVGPPPLPYQAFPLVELQ